MNYIALLAAELAAAFAASAALFASSAAFIAMFASVAFMSTRIHVSRIHVRREILVDVHGVVGIVVAAASGNRQGRTGDQDKSTHSRLPIYLRSAAVARFANRADNSLKHEAPSRDFAWLLQAIEKWQETTPQGAINSFQRNLFPKFGKAGDPIFADPAGNDAAEMCQIRGDIEGDAVERDPALDAHAQARRFSLPRGRPRPRCRCALRRGGR